MAAMELYSEKDSSSLKTVSLSFDKWNQKEETEGKT